MRGKCDSKEGNLNWAHPFPRVSGSKRGSEIVEGRVYLLTTSGPMCLKLKFIASLQLFLNSLPIWAYRVCGPSVNGTRQCPIQSNAVGLRLYMQLEVLAVWPRTFHISNAHLESFWRSWYCTTFENSYLADSKFFAFDPVHGVYVKTRLRPNSIL